MLKGCKGSYPFSLRAFFIGKEHLHWKENEGTKKEKHHIHDEELIY